MRCLSGSDTFRVAWCVWSMGRCYNIGKTLESKPWVPWSCALCKDWGSHSHHPLIWSATLQWDIFDLKPSFDDEGIKLQVHWNALEMLHFPSALWPRFLGDICVTVHLCEELWGCVGNTACWLSEGWWEGRRVVCMGRICVGGSVFLR